MLDLYAGSGAVGLEALSRGAARVLLVESDARAARVIRANIAARRRCPAASSSPTGWSGCSAGGPGAEAAYDLVVADPPYAVTADEVTGMLTALATGGWLAPGALVAVERATRSGPGALAGRVPADRSRRYGEATFWYGLAAGA